MRKVYLAIAVIIFSSFQNLNAQNCWSALGSGVGADSYYDGLEAMTTYNGNLIVAGHFNASSGVATANIAQWNGTSWSALGSGLKMRTGLDNNYEGFISVLAVYNNELYAAGSFDSAGGQPASGIAKWNGTSWSPVGSGLLAFFNGQFGSVDASINTMAVYNGALYVGGNFDTIGGIAAGCIAKWDGISWSSVADGVGTGQERSEISVGSLCIYNGVLYAGGGFNNASGVPALNIAAWDGNTWSALGNGLGNDTLGNGGVSAIAVYDDQIYAAVAGSDPNQGYAQIYYITKWNGTSWSSIAGGPGTGIYNVGLITSMLSFNNNLVIAGEFEAVGNDTSASGLAQWNGNTWSDLAGGLDTFFYFRLTNYNDHLYVGGLFSGVGTASALNVAEYTCATSPSGISEISSSLNTHIYPNPTAGTLNIAIDSSRDNAIVEIYNLLGQKVLQAELNYGKTELNLTGHTNGTYLYRITDVNGAVLGSGSFIIQ